MHTVKISCLIVMIFLVPLCVLTSAPSSYLLPINSDIGPIVEGDAATIEGYARQALTTPYTLEWVEAYIPPSLAQGFVITYGELLSTILPVPRIQMGKAIQRTHLWEVPFAIIEPTYRWGSMVWIDQDDGRWALLSISISE